MSGALAPVINAAASKYGVPASLVKAVATQESSLGQASRNVMQVNGMDNASPEASIDAGTKMLAQYWKQTGGNIGWTLAMYNMGPGIYSWAKARGITDPKQAMQAFSTYQRNKLGWSGYGDPNYIDHVERYLK